MVGIFIPYSHKTDFWSDDGNIRAPSQEFWQWAETVLGERSPLGEDPTASTPWAIIPHNQATKEIDEDGHGIKRPLYENGRLISFDSADLAMMFKLRWF